MSFWDDISERLAALTGSATPVEARDALNEFNVRDIEAVRVSEGGGGGSSPVLTATKTLTAGEILSLQADCVEVVAAPGANKVLVPIRVIGLYMPGDTPYSSNPSAKLVLGPGIPPGTVSYPLLDNTEINDILASTENTVFFLGNEQGITAFTAAAGAWDVTSEFADLALCAFFFGGGFFDGTGTCQLTVWYTIAELA